MFLILLNASRHPGPSNGSRFPGRPIAPTPALLAVLLVCLCLWPVAARCGELLVEEMALPARFGPLGVLTPLEAVVVRPRDQARHPLAVINHGSPRDKDDRPKMTAISRLREAEEFARRGFAVVVFLRRGFGASAGGFVEGVGPGGDPDYAASGRKAAEDIREVIRIMKTMPYVDPGKIICIGQSAGGLATTALAADPPQGLVAAINFAGGKGSSAPDVVRREDKLVRAFGEYGRTARIPMLFVYSENDHFFGPRLAREFYAAFTAAGGQADFIMAPPFGEDGHALFSRKGVPLWTPTVDAFLSAQGLKQPGTPIAVQRPRTSPPGRLSDSGRDAFERYLDAPPHKAFVMGPRGGYGWSTGKRTLEEARDQAMENCRKNGNDGCAPVMLDDRPR